MPKISNKYLEIDPFKIIEKGFHKDKALVSESIFSLGNEYSGVRGFFDEDYSGNKLIGTYFNGIYEYAKEETPNAYKGIVKRTHFTINSCNFFLCKIEVEGEILDLNISKFSDFQRELDMKSGLYIRSFVWKNNKCNIKIKIERLLNMKYPHRAIQRFSFESDRDVILNLTLSLDSNILHWGHDCYFNKDKEFNIDDSFGLSAKTLTTNQSIVSMFSSDEKETSYNLSDKRVDVSYIVSLRKNEEKVITKYIVNLVDKKSNNHIDELINNTKNELDIHKKDGFNKTFEDNKKFFNDLFESCDIEIGGDPLNQQGIRYCLFQLAQTYHGFEPDNNIGAKGLTGEAYSGHAFWDSETYCLPYYLFSNKEASLNLLMFRYNTLDEARKRAIDLDCEGACYPIATRNGKEGCNLWQHASLQFQPSTAVFYAIYHYMNLYNDDEFMNKYGLEMITEIAKFLLSRGDFNQDHTKFGFYNVMGPDEFQMMVNHNTYTNFMAKKVFDYLLNIIETNKYETKEVFNKCAFSNKHILKMKEASRKMVILYDEKTHLFEQHEGFFDLPHIDINKIPLEDFPLYSHWSYDRIYRNDMIKQPDVLMFMFLYNQDFSYEDKLANYEYYEPRCIHESSLSPSIHSIFACELNKPKEAYKFFGFATRLDLDDYNRNTKEGIHTTSIAAAWMNIVYGFGGLRSDKETLKLNPMIIDDWDYYSFKIKYKGSMIKVYVDKKYTKIKVTGNKVLINIYSKDYLIEDELVLER